MSEQKDKDPAEWTRAHQIASELAAPFADKDLGWKPVAFTRNNAAALCAAFVDARDVEDRLDAVMGIDGWKDSYEFLSDGSVICTLSLRFDKEWIPKSDVGSESKQTDARERRKAAVSDALKRAAAKWGVGRYIYQMELVEMALDNKKKVIGPWKDKSSPQQRPVQQPQQQKPQQPAQQKPQPQQAKQRTDEERAADVFARLRKIEERMVGEGLCKQGMFMVLIQDAAQKRHSQPRDPLSWRGDLEWVKDEIARIEQGFLLVRDRKGSAVPVPTGS